MKYFISYVKSNYTRLSGGIVDNSCFYSTYRNWDSITYDNIKEFETTYKCVIINIIKLDK